MDALADSAIEIVLAHEGGLEDDPDDPGGLTNWGFDLRSNPDLTADQLRAMTREEAKQRYHDRLWVPMRWDHLPPAIATKEFDLSVVMGATSAVTVLQRALRACGRPVSEDGALGSLTIAAASQADAVALLAALKSEGAGHFRLVAAAHSAESKFLTGWLNRCYA